MFVLIEVIEREVSAPVFFVKEEDAEARMLDLFSTASGIDKECILNDPDSCLSDDTNIEVEDGYAYTTVHGQNMDWKIFEVDDETLENSK